MEISSMEALAPVMLRHGMNVLSFYDFDLRFHIHLPIYSIYIYIIYIYYIYIHIIIYIPTIPNPYIYISRMYLSCIPSRYVFFVAGSQDAVARTVPWNHQQVVTKVSGDHQQPPKG